MGCTFAQPVQPQPVQPQRQPLTLERLIQWWPQLNSREARVEWCVGQPPPRGDAPPGNLTVNGVREDSFVDGVEVDEIML